MPTYQYACQGCDERFEVVQAFTDPTLTVHEPGCGAPVRKLFGSVGVVFKGSGFYRNDSRDSSKSTEGGGDTKAESTSDSTTSSSADTKSDSKPDSKPSGDTKSPAAAPAKTESKPAASAPAA